MPRNLDTRVELVAPVRDADLRAELLDTLERCFADNANAWELGPTAPGCAARRAEEPRNVQDELRAWHAARAAEAQAAAQLRRSPVHARASGTPARSPRLRHGPGRRRPRPWRPTTPGTPCRPCAGSGRRPSARARRATSPNVPSRVLICFGLARIASQIRSAASSGEIVGKQSYIFVGAIIGVRTSGMWIVVKVTLSPIVSELADARERVERRLGGDVGARSAAGSSGRRCEETLTMWPRAARACAGAARGSA